MTIPIVIPTVPKREEMAIELAKTLTEAHSWASVRVSRSTGNSRLDVAKAVSVAHEDADGSEWWIHLEDDVILGPAFGDIPNILRRAERAWDYGCVTFFHPTDDLPDCELTPISASGMLWCQCLAVRTLNVDEFARFADRFFREHPEHYHAPDPLLYGWVHFLGERCLRYSPSLVQHRYGPSTWKGRAFNRQSASFRRAFGEVEGAIQSA